MNLLDIANLLESQGVGVKGKSIFIYMIPSDAQPAILLRNPLTGTPYDYELPGFFRAKFRVVVRCVDYATGKAMMDEAVAAMTVQNTQLDSMFVQYMRPIAMPVVFPLSDGNLMEFSVDMDVVFTE